MARGARKIEVDNEGELVEVILWVNYEGEQQISIDSEQDHFDTPVAAEIADAVKELIAWADTPEGKKQIAKMQKLEKEDFDRTIQRRRSAKR